MKFKSARAFYFSSIMVMFQLTATIVHAINNDGTQVTISTINAFLFILLAMFFIERKKS